jgi:hypothetical protein
MGNFRLLSLTLLLVVLVLLNSCSSDNPTDNNQEGDFTFLNTGNWWLYEKYIIDSLGNKTGNSTNDSTYTDGTESILGKTAFKIKTISPGAEDVVNYCYTEGEKYFMYSDFVNQVINKMLVNLPVQLPISLDSMWVKMADYNSNSWLVKIDTIPPTEIFPPITISGTFTVSGEKGTTKNMTIESKSYTAQEFKLIFKFKGIISILPSVEQEFTITIHSWFDRKVGILLQTYDESKFNLGAVGSYTFEGFEKKLLKYSVTVPFE